MPLNSTENNKELAKLMHMKQAASIAAVILSILLLSLSIVVTAQNNAFN
jgi:hypothetical protein